MQLSAVRWSASALRSARRTFALAGGALLVVGAQSAQAALTPVPTRPAAVPTPVTLSSSGRFPDVLVDGAGTSHIVWITSDGVSADAVHYCRLKRASTACDNPPATQTFVPQKDYGPGDDPRFNTSTDGARILRVGQQIVILDYRYPTDYPKPDGSDPSRTVLEWVSEDGGNSFTGPGLVGNQPINGGAVEYGPDNNPKILTTTDTVTGGTYVQAISPGQFASVSANLGAAGPNQAYSGSLALDGGLPVAAFADLSNQSLVRRYTGAGSPSDVANWTPATVVSGEEPKLAGGPGGLFMMNRPSYAAPYVVRRISGNQAGPPVQVSDANGPVFRDFTETPSGRLLAAWESRGGSSPGVNIRTSPDANGWSGSQKLIDGTANGQIRVDAAGDGGGIAVLNHTGGVNSLGQIVAIAYGTRKPTGAPGIAGIPGGGDPSATTSCQQITFGVVKIAGELGCFSHGTGALANVIVTDGELNLNGLRIIPDANVQILIDARKHTLKATGNVRVLLEGGGVSLTLWHGALDVSLPAPNAETDLFNFDMSKFAADLKGFPISAKLDVKLESGGVRIPIDLKLPAVFGGVTGHAELRADSQTGLHLDSLAIAISNAPIGPLLADFSIQYTSSSDQWEGHGALKFPPQPAGLVINAGAIFRAGHFIHGDIDIKPFGYGVPIFTDVYIDDMNGGIDLEPHTVITAGVGIGAIPIGPPTGFVNTMQVNGKIAVTIANPFKIEVTGTGALLGVDIATAHMLFISNGYLEVSGQISLSFQPAFEFSGGLNAVVDLPHKVFSAEGKADLKVAGVALTSVDGIISSSGFAVCGDLPVPPFSRVTVGHHWNHDFTDLIPSFDWLHLHACDLSDYHVQASPARASAAAAGLGIAVPQARAVNIAVRGAGAPPSVLLTAPDGTQITPAVDTMQAAAATLAAAGGPPAAAFQVPNSNATVVVLKNPRAGTWRVAAQPGSAAIAGLAESHTLAAASVHARVLGRGRQLRLAYSLHPRPGMSVSFVEFGTRVAHVIGTARGARGTLRFSPGDGPAGTRQIVALINQDGVPRPRAVLTSYRAPGPLRPGSVRRLKVSLRGHTLTVSFGAASNASGYQIRVTSTDGKRRVLLASAARRSVRLGDIGPGARATVSVKAVAANGLTGPAAVGSTPRKR